MRLLGLSLAWIICFSLAAQNQPDQREYQACVTITAGGHTFLKCQSTQDRRPEARDFARNAHVGDPWWPTGGGPITVKLVAASIHQDGPVMRLRGSVEISTSSLHLQADEADYHGNDGQIDAYGNVRITPVHAIGGAQ